MLAVPLKSALPIFLAVVSWTALVAVEALPFRLAFIVAGNFKVTFAEPLTETALPVLVPSLSDTDIFLAVPHWEVVIFPDPSKDVPFIVLAVCNFTAVFAEPPTEEEPA